MSRHLTGARRTHQGNRNLGYLLAFVAGAINAGGYLAVQQYTSHMTGIVSAMADMVAIGQYRIAGFGLLCLLTFISGAACTTVMVNIARARKLHSEYALPLVVEAVLLITFGLLGARAGTLDGSYVAATILVLSFVMGMQNALITKISDAVIRTTHVTGIVTDLGIDLGRWLFSRSPSGAASATYTFARTPMLALLLVAFFVGGVTGGFGFQTFGFAATVPPALALIAAGIMPVIDDLRRTKDSPRD